MAASKRTGVSVHKTKWLTKWKIDGIDKTNRPSETLDIDINIVNVKIASWYLYVY